MTSLKIKIIGIALAGSLSTSAFAERPESPESKAIAYFELAQVENGRLSNEQVLNLKKTLSDTGYTEKGETGAVLLGAGCGDAGCTYGFLVSTEYFTGGANTRTQVIAGVVTASTYEQQATINKVLSLKQIKELLR